MTDEKRWSEIKHFSSGEFDSPDEPGSGIKMNLEFVKLIDNIRAECGFPLHINSGYRTEAHNAKVGGKSESAHTRGLACDILIANSAERYKLIKAAIRQGITRIGVGKTFLHLDIDYTLPQNVCWLYEI